MISSIISNTKYAFYAILAVIILFGYSSSYYMSSEVIEVKIKDKERATTGSGENISSKFIVYSENEVFENTDSWLFMKFDSSDIQNDLSIGETYKIKVAGWRVPFFSWYRNIVAIK